MKTTLISLGEAFWLAIDIEREGGPFWLSLTGREGVKPFIMAEVGDHLKA